MRVPALSIVFMVFSAILAIGMPVFLFVFFRKKLGLKFLPMLLGVAGMVIFALILEALVHRVVLGKFPLRQEAPVLFIVYGALMAGIFEESARFIAFRILKRKYNGHAAGPAAGKSNGKAAGIETALSYGIGHGGIESIILAGLSMILVIATSILFNTGNADVITGKAQGEALAVINTQMDVLAAMPSYTFLISGIERMIALIAQLSLSVIMFYSVYGEKRLLLFPLAIAVHALIDVPAAAMQAGLMQNLFLVEGITLLAAVAVALLAKCLHEKLKSGMEAVSAASVADGI